jgi:hypothetical protein
MPEDEKTYPVLNSVGAIVTCFAVIPVTGSKSDKVLTYCYRPKNHPGKCNADVQPEDIPVLARRRFNGYTESK